jgi:hypothetical protein
MDEAKSLRLLVKARNLRAAPALAANGVAFSSKPLMPNVDRARTQGLGAAAASASAQWHEVTLPKWQGSVWDACHVFSGSQGLGAAGGVEFVEPDLPQQWLYDEKPNRKTLGAAADAAPESQDTHFPSLPNNDWYRDSTHAQFLDALAQLGPKPPVVRVAHLDTGYDPAHRALPDAPKQLRTDLAKSFVEDPPTNDATDKSSGFLNNHGHGTGTLSLLAGRDPNDRSKSIGAAPFVEVVPIRVANRVVLFSNSAIAKAFDYVCALCDSEETRIHVVTMSMGGVASQAWADAINALYERGVFVVTAGGNNFANLPTHNIVYPARFNRVVAACGVMANGKPYADLSPTLMAGNYGPASKMKTAISAYTPNTPWARLGAPAIVDHDGAGTSAATPQVAAAAALWIAKNQTAYAGYAQGWMRVEAIRTALFRSAETAEEKHFGAGLLQASAALAIKPAAAELTQQPKDDVDFALFKVLTGLGAAASRPAPTQRMLELEALQLAETSEIEKLMPDPQAPFSREVAVAVAKALLADSRASHALRNALAGALGASNTPAPVPPKPRPKKKSDTEPPADAALPQAADALLPGQSTAIRKLQRLTALNPPIDRPKRRKLQVYAYDPSLGTSLETLGINRALIDVKWEKLEPGPAGEYLEVVDVDPASNTCYAPIDLDNPHLLSQQGLAPSETDPRFHQQMAYAVASRTIEFFERALGRVALWAPRMPCSPAQSERYVQRLRIYPHALRAANAYYSPEKKALLLGYFNAGDSDPSENAPGSLVFTALSHDIIAHETTHALLDGLHHRYTEATNPDVLAFHEGFADIVALFQHFTMPEALKTQIAATRGDLRRQSLLGALAVQFGHATGNYGALRDAIGTCDAQGVWHPREPKTTDYASATEPHERGAVLVAAMFDAFLQLYRARTADLIRLATGGTGILGEGALSADLTERLAQEAALTARHCLEISIRALDYCPPVDITFHDYLRALITADRDVAPEDSLGYRVAFVSGFRARGIASTEVRSVSPESLAWEPPPLPLTGLGDVLKTLTLDWNLTCNRRHAYHASRHNAVVFRKWLMSDAVSDEELAMLGLVRHERPLTLGGRAGQLGAIEVHSVRPSHRIGPDRQGRAELVVEMTQTWKDKPTSPDIVFRGGCTMIVDLERNAVLYLVRKRVDHGGRFAAQAAFQAAASLNPLRANYFKDHNWHGETFAALHAAR